MDEKLDPLERTKESVRTLIRQGRIEAALGEVHVGSATERQLVEELRIYQAELELQNEQLRAAEAAAAVAHERFRQLFQIHPEPVLLLDAQGRIVECNEAAARLFGIGSLTDSHLYLSQRLGAAWRGAFLRSLSDASAGGAQQLSHVALLTPGGETTATWDVRLCSVRDEHAPSTQCLAVLVDQARLLLRQDELQQRIDQQARQITEVNQQALSIATAHSRVAASLIADLQTPLGRLSRFARSLHDAASAPLSQVAPEARSRIDAIIEAASTLQRIVSDLAVAMQSESGTLQPRPSRTDLGRLVREACRTEAWADTRGVHVDVVGTVEAVPVLADTGLIDHALRILIRRAVARGSRGERVEVRVHRTDPVDDRKARAVVEITCPRSRQDDSDLDRLFSLFARPRPEDGESESDRLAMLSCRVMVELHGGRIGAQRVDDGTRFHFWIPM